MLDEISTKKATVSRYWDEKRDAEFNGETYWLANPTVNRRFNYKSVGGRRYASWPEFTVRHFLQQRLPVDTVLSIGCGEGGLERHLIDIEVAKKIEGLDISNVRIEQARAFAEEHNVADRLKYFNVDAEIENFPSHQYDAIYFNSSLHHMERVDQILTKCAESLKPDGYLFVNEYVGPNRFSFSDEEINAMESAFRLIPEIYRVSHEEHDRGCVRKKMGVPDPLEVAKIDPSEAIKSEEIVSGLYKNFEIVEFNEMGGTLLQFVLNGIAGNFSESDTNSMQILEMLFNIEDALINTGSLNSHFASVVAKRKF